MFFLKHRKKKLRARMAEARKGLAEKHPDAAEALVRNFPDSIWPKIGDVVSGFVAIKGEIDPVRLMAAFALEGAVTALPVTLTGNWLEFREWRPGDPLENRKMGLKEPPDTANRVKPRLILTPLLAFDEQGGRLGWGGGFYDREIARLREAGNVTVVGIAFDAQKVKRVPTGRHDQLLDWIVTERTNYRVLR